MRYFYIIPAAVIVAGILVGHAQVERDVPSAPTPVAAVNPSGATSVMPSPPASVSSVTPEARVNEETGNGGDGGRLEAVVTPTPTDAGVAQAQSANRWTGDRNPVGDAGSSPAPGTTVVTATLVAEPVTKEDDQNLYYGDLWSVIQATFPAYEWETAYRVAMCESGGNPGAVGAAGEQGAFQVLARYHGPVPADLYGQAAQAAQIVAAHGWGPWSCH